MKEIYFYDIYFNLFYAYSVNFADFFRKLYEQEAKFFV